MKLILYIIALVCIAGAAWFSKTNIEKHEEQLNLTKLKQGQIKKEDAKIEAKREKIALEEAERTKAKDENNALTADIQDVLTPELKGSKKQSVSLEESLEKLVAEKDEIERVLAEIKKELEGEDVPLDGVEEFVTGLEDKQKDLNKENVALQEAISVFSERVQENTVVLNDFKAAQIKRRKNLNANKVSSLITAVDNEWGFVVVKPHADAIIKEESKLLVIRGNRHIGRLSINAIEGGRVLANIDYSSIASGMRIRPGDRVILSKSLTK